MTNILELAFSGPVIIYTILLMVALVYWCLVIIGALDLGAVDFDLDMDLDVDVDIDVDVDVDVDTDVDVQGGGAFLSVLKFFNFGALPFMLIYSFLALFMWVLAMLLNLYLSDGTIIFSILMIIPILFVALFLTKLVTTPLIGMFGNMDNHETEIDMIGKTGTIVLPVTKERTGQIELYERGRFMTLQVRLSENSTETIHNGQKAVIVAINSDDTIYFVEPYK